jgi:hypothetical protein
MKLTRSVLLEAIANCFGQQVEPISAAAEVLAAHQDAVAEYFQSILAQPEVMAAIAQRSYWHNNGFAKLILHKNDLGYCIRLHAWLDFAAVVERAGNVHNHRWDFASVNLSGAGLVSRNFLPGATGERYHAFSYDRRATNFIFRPLGTVELGDQGESVVERGEVYICRTDQLHIVRPMPGPQMFTLVVQGPATLPAATVYSRFQQPSQLSESRNPISPKEVAMLVAAALNHHVGLDGYSWSADD